MKIKLYLLIIILISSSLFFSCSKTQNQSQKAYFVTSNIPLCYILREITGDSTSVVSLMPAGESEHTFSPTPKDINLLSNAKGVFYVSDQLDGWAVNLNRDNKFALLDIVPNEILLKNSHSHENESSHTEEGESIDPHFWLDPIAVKKIIPSLTGIMSQLNKADSAKYHQNGELLNLKLSVLYSDIKIMLSPYAGNNVILFHPSFVYFLKRFGLNYAGSIEESPGKEPTPKYLMDLSKKVKDLNLKTLYIEPQLSEKSAKPLAEATGLKLGILDPLGGYEGRANYFDLIRFNALNILKGFN